MTNTLQIHIHRLSSSPPPPSHPQRHSGRSSGAILCHGPKSRSRPAIIQSKLTPPPRDLTSPFLQLTCFASPLHPSSSSLYPLYLTHQVSYLLTQPAYRTNHLHPLALPLHSAYNLTSLHYVAYLSQQPAYFTYSLHPPVLPLHSACLATHTMYLSYLSTLPIYFMYSVQTNRKIT